MRLVRLAVENLAGVKKAAIEFAAGLNVLYGPNETGKSTLAQAIRGALLLQSTSSSHEPWIPWGTAHAPTVELVFETEPQRFWRVKKSFGERGEATLQESKDAISFSDCAKGRRVDGDLRKLLRWGVPEPGLKAQRGWPETYLTAALLAPQDAVTQVFDRSLAKDPEGSGKERITHALQALAAHPLFIQALKHAEEHVSTAFTANGQKKTAKESPFRKISDKIQTDRTRLDQLNEQVTKSGDVENRLRDARNERQERHDALQTERGQLAAERAAWERLRVADVRRAEARAEFDRVSALHRAVADKEAERARLLAAATAAEKRLAEAEAVGRAAEQALAAASDRLRAAQSGEQVAARQLELSQLKNRLLALDAEAAELQRAREQFAERSKVQERLKKSGDELAALRAKVAARQKQLDDLQRSLAASEGERRLLDGVAVWLQRDECLSDCRRLEGLSATAAEHQKQAREKRTQGEKLRTQVAKKKLPTPEQLAALRQQAEELRVAEAKLEVGVSVTITPLKKFDGAVACDGQRSKKQTFAEEETIEAESRVKLTVGNLAELVVTGGKPDARKVVAALRKRWNAEGQPALEAAGVESVAELSEACRAADEQSRQAKELLDAAEQLDRRAQDALAQCGRLAELQARAAEIETAWATHDQPAVTARCQRERPTAREIDRLKKQLDADVAKSRERSAKLQAEQTGDSTREQMLAEDEARQRDHLAALSATAPTADPEPRLQANRSDHAATKRQLDALSQQADRAAGELQQQVTAAEKQRDAAEAARKTAAEEHTRTAAALARCDGELDERRRSAATAPLDAARAAHEAAESAWSALPESERQITPESLAMREARIAEDERQLQKLEREMAEQEGALKLVGGDVARERYATLKEAIERYQQDEVELEQDLNAWKLLRDTLREVEQSDAQHLGRALVPTITSRFRELTGDRFGDLELGPQLETSGIQAAGGSRDLKSLSVGTREQLSVLLRIALAEQLATVVLLDDQLTQSDPRRLAQFRRLLRDAAAKTQILVFTCRPEDYVAPTELPSGTAAQLDAEDGLVRVVNLQRIIAA